MAILVAGLFSSGREAMVAIRALEVDGYSPGEVGLISDKAADPADADHRKVVGAAIDVAADETPSIGTAVGVGAVSGATVGILAAAGVVVAPFLAPMTIFGWLGSTAAAAIWGGTVGGFVAWLMDEGVPQELGNAYVDAVNRGASLVIVRLADGEGARAGRAEAIMSSSGMLASPSGPAIRSR